MRSLTNVLFVVFTLFSLCFCIALTSNYDQPVDCDHQLGSDRKPDACGVCGGDNSTCLSDASSSAAQPHSFEWVMSAPGPCVPKCPSAKSYQLQIKHRNPSSSSSALSDDDEDESEPDDIWPAYQMSKPFCVRISLSRRHLLQSVPTQSMIEALRNLQVSEHLCDSNRKPNVLLKKCQSAYTCPAK